MSYVELEQKHNYCTRNPEVGKIHRSSSTNGRRKLDVRKHAGESKQLTKNPQEIITVDNDEVADAWIKQYMKAIGKTNERKH
jgi:hypothetical protein